MAKKVKIVVTEEDSFKDNVTYKKNVVISIVSLATQEINGIASISRNSVSAIKSALSKNINRGIIVDVYWRFASGDSRWNKNGYNSCINLCCI